MVKSKAKKGSDVASESDHIIVQLPITSERIQEILMEHQAYSEDDIQLEPMGYMPDNNFASHVDESVGNTQATGQKKRSCCFWCCHPLEHMHVGLPISYDAILDTFTMVGTFCSFECAAAYNFSVYQGSDRVWEILSWIQYLSDKMGLGSPVRPAPSRYSLQMFGGPLHISEFRSIHRSAGRTILCNIPPFISVVPQTEVVNTSYLCPHMDADRMLQAQEKMRLTRKRAVVDPKKTLDQKMNLVCTELD